MSDRVTKILLVEDEPADVDMLKRFLQKTSYNLHVDHVEDGDACMAYLRNPKKPKPDVIFLDLRMPQKDGREVLAEMKVDQELHQIPVVIYSSSRIEADVAKCYKLGCSAYCIKGSTLTEIAEVSKTLADFWGKHVVYP